MEKSLNSDKETETNSSLDIVVQVEDDFFSEMYSNTILKHFTIATFFIGTFFGIISMSGMIWYERKGNHRYRTVVNQLVSTLLWIVVWYISLVYIPEGARYLVGPLNETYCEVHNWLKNFLFIGAFLTLDCISLLRYAFIFNWKNFAVINDDLIAIFLNLCIALLSFWLCMVKRLSFGRMPLNYYMCAGKDPNEMNGGHVLDHMPGKYNTIIPLLGVSVVLQMFVFTKIFLYQRKMEQKRESIELGRINASEGLRGNPKIAWPERTPKRLPNLLSKSMIDFTTQILGMLYLVIVFIVQNAMSYIDPIRLNDYENRWYAYFLQIIGIAVAINAISLVYYARNKLVSKAVWRRIKERWQD